jgi:CheY-like chemotaxis protein
MLPNTPDRSSEENQYRRWRALVVDDMPAVCRATAMILSALGGEITTATNGAEAVDIVHIAQKFGLGFDLVLTDVQMPVMNGIEATRRMRNEGFTGSIIAFSGSDDPDISKKCLNAGCDEFVNKPVTLESLALVVLSHCSGSGRHSSYSHRISKAASIAMTNA